jgi:hypothetical protein
VRVYIDTLLLSQVNNSNCKSCDSIKESQSIQPLIIIGIVIVAIIAMSFSALLIKKPKQ